MTGKREKRVKKSPYLSTARDKVEFPCNTALGKEETEELAKRVNKKMATFMIIKTMTTLFNSTLDLNKLITCGQSVYILGASIVIHALHRDHSHKYTIVQNFPF
jgi:hypothetical protein